MNKKILTYLMIAIVAALLGPLVINRLYQVEKPLIITEWGAVDVLDYYGTIMGAIISVLVILITITNEHEKIAIERREEKQRIEEQRLYDNIIGILDKLSDTIVESLQFFNPNRLYNIYYGYSISYKSNTTWLLDLSNDSEKYLDRVDWLAHEFNRRIDELSCYGIDVIKLQEIYRQLLTLQLAYLRLHHNIVDIGLKSIQIKADALSEDFDVEYTEILHAGGENARVYEHISTESAKVIQNIRIQVVQKKCWFEV